MLKRAFFNSLIVLSLLALTITPANAAYIGCSPQQISDIEKARINAFDALSAATVQITAQNGAYRTWFGAWDALRSKEVRNTIAALKTHIRTSKITYVCERNNSPACRGGTYAYVYPDESDTIYLCPPYFDLPQLSDATFLDVFNSGTRGGTIIHEMSHYVEVGNTDDSCYDRDVCSAFARTSPGRAVNNADSFQYFTEDTYLKAR